MELFGTYRNVVTLAEGPICWQWSAIGGLWRSSRLVQRFIWRPTKRSEVEDFLKFMSTDIPFAHTPVFVVDTSTLLRFGASGVIQKHGVVYYV